jgi:hypothetical protein
VVAAPAGLAGTERAGTERAGTERAGEAGEGAGGGGPVPGQAVPDAEEVLRQLRILLGPLLAAAAPEPAFPPLPRRQPGQVRPGIPRQLAGRAFGPPGGQEGGPVAGQEDEPPAGRDGGLLAGDGDLLKLADSEEAWW